MQVKNTQSKGLNRAYEVTVTAKEIEDKLNARLESIGKSAKIPGFRPGKIPLQILKQHYKSDALAKVLETLADDSVKKILKDDDLKPALKPKVNIKSFEEGKDLILTIDLEILPKIDKINLDNLSFEKHVVEIPEKNVTHVLETLAKRSRSSRPLEKPRKTKKGDIVIIDFKGFIKDKEIEGGSGQNHPLELGAGEFIPGFEDQLIGKEKGDYVEVKVTFPKEYHEAEYANKEARFDVTINDIHEADPVKIDKALAEKLGFETVDKMKEAVEKSISKDYEAQSFLSIKRHVLDALSDRFDFEIPQSMVDLEFNSIWDQLCHEIGVDHGHDHDHAANTNAKDKKGTKSFKEATGKTEEELRKEYHAIAERRVRLGLLLAEIGNRNSISVTNQELIAALNAKAREYPGQEKEVFEFYKSNESALASLRAPIFENKVIEFILGKSKIKEKKISPEQLEKLLIKEEEEEAEKKIMSASKKEKKE